MKSREKILDISVAVLLSLVLFWAIGISLYLWFGPGTTDQKQLVAKALSPSPLLEITALTTCFVLSLWLIIGKGAESKLWNWLPPLVFGRKSSKLWRTISIILLIFGTLLGMFAEFLGLPQDF